MTTGLEKAATAYAAVDVQEIANFERDISKLINEWPDAKAILEDQRLSALIYDIGVLSEYLRSKAMLAALLKYQGSSPRRLLEIAKLDKALASFPIDASDITPITSFSLEKLRLLEAAIDEIEGMKLIAFGYLFAGKKLRATAKLLSDQCKIESEKPHRELGNSNRFATIFGASGITSQKNSLNPNSTPLFFSSCRSLSREVGLRFYSHTRLIVHVGLTMQCPNLPPFLPLRRTSSIRQCSLVTTGRWVSWFVSQNLSSGRRALPLVSQTCQKSTISARKPKSRV